MKTLIVFSHLRWNFVFQRPQHLLTRLAKYYKILFVEEPVNQGSVFIEATQVAPNIQTLVPHTVETGWGFSDDQLAVIAPMLKAWIIENHDLEDGYGLWFYTPLALPLKDSFGPEFIVFDVMDELSLFAFAPPILKEREDELLEIADVVIAGGPSLYEAKRQVRPDTISLPSAVDANHYSPIRAAEAEAMTHDDDKIEHDIPFPRLGFFGVIDERMDLDLVAAIADADPHWHVVMVGPTFKIDPISLPQRPNIHWLGLIPYSVLPQVVQTWDVCLMPFVINDSTKFISPTKTLEYMAAEKPIVSTPIHDVIELYSDVVEVGHTHDEFIDLIRETLGEDAVTRAVRVVTGKDIVKRSSWDDAAEKVHQAIEDMLAKKFAKPD